MFYSCVKKVLFTFGIYNGHLFIVDLAFSHNLSDVVQDGNTLRLVERLVISVAACV